MRGQAGKHVDESLDLAFDTSDRALGTNSLPISELCIRSSFARAVGLMRVAFRFVVMIVIMMMKVILLVARLTSGPLFDDLGAALDAYREENAESSSHVASMF